MCTYVFYKCLVYKVTMILDKVTASTDFVLYVSFILKRKMFKTLIFSILICELILNIFIYVC